jgi:hypothetical protein
MTIEHRHIPFLILTAIPPIAAAEPLSIYLFSTIHVTELEQWVVVLLCSSVIVMTLGMWSRIRAVLPLVLIAYGRILCMVLMGIQWRYFERKLYAMAVSRRSVPFVRVTARGCGGGSSMGWELRKRDGHGQWAGNRLIRGLSVAVTPGCL